MAQRVRPIAVPGSLLKGEKTKPRRTKRQEEPDYLAAIRKCPCLACDQDPAGVAAHVRMIGGPGKQQALGKKPDDRWVLPMCQKCHERQHSIGEKSFWAELGIDPLNACLDLWEFRYVIRDAAFKIRSKRRL